MLKVALVEYYFVWDAAVDGLEDLYELKPVCAFSGKVTLVLGGLLYKTRSV